MKLYLHNCLTFFFNLPDATQHFYTTSEDTKLVGNKAPDRFNKIAINVETFSK